MTQKELLDVIERAAKWLLKSSLTPHSRSEPKVTGEDPGFPEPIMVIAHAVGASYFPSNGSVIKAP